MGILDNIFSGEKGVSAVLHKTFGTNAKIRIKKYNRDQLTGIMHFVVSEFDIYFVPDNTQYSVEQLNAPNASRSDFRHNECILSGTFPTAQIDASITPEKDTIVYCGIEYTIQSADLVKVGDKNVQYSITARRG